MSNSDFPQTFQALQPESQSNRARVFDPALRHFPRAFRLGAPHSASYHEMMESASQAALMRSHLLRLIAGSRWQPLLVLRGGTLLHALLPDQAREPHDIDFVFRSPEVELNSPLCSDCYAELRELMAACPGVGELEILPRQIASDEIWTYERAQGRRLIVPFAKMGQNTGGAPCGEIQIDIVWGEPIPAEPIKTRLPLHSGGFVEFWAATPELSLAWKLLWLITDGFPQGKDLYDATLLAENFSMPRGLLEGLFDAHEERQCYQTIEKELMNLNYIDWANFQLEYPWVQGTQAEWLERLQRALMPSFISQ